MIRFKALAISEIGTVRKSNEDHLYISGETRTDELGLSTYWRPMAKIADGALFAVCDGMGGEAFGEEASWIAVSGLATVENHLLRRQEASFEDLMASYLRQANKRVCARIREHQGQRMGTTFSALYLQHQSFQAVHLGDSRIYLWRDGDLRLLTHDHTRAQELADAGEIEAKAVATHSERHALTRHLGIFPHEARLEPFFVKEERLQVGDRLLLCSDGLSDMLNDQEIATLIATHHDVRSLAEELVQAAILAGGKDNITLIVIDVEQVDDVLLTRQDEQTLQRLLDEAMRTEEALSESEPFVWKKAEPLRKTIENTSDSKVDEVHQRLDASAQTFSESCPSSSEARSEEGEEDREEARRNEQLGDGQNQSEAKRSKEEDRDVKAKKAAAKRKAAEKVEQSVEQKSEGEFDRNEKRGLKSSAQLDAELDAQFDAELGAETGVAHDAMTGAQADARTVAQADAARTDARTDVKAGEKTRVDGTLKAPEGMEDVTKELPDADTNPLPQLRQDWGNSIASSQLKAHPTDDLRDQKETDAIKIEWPVRGQNDFERTARIYGGSRETLWMQEQWSRHFETRDIEGQEREASNETQEAQFDLEATVKLPARNSKELQSFDAPQSQEDVAADENEDQEGEAQEDLEQTRPLSVQIQEGDEGDGSTHTRRLAPIKKRRNLLNTFELQDLMHSGATMRLSHIAQPERKKFRESSKKRAKQVLTLSDRFSQPITTDDLDRFYQMRNQALKRQRQQQNEELFAELYGTGPIGRLRRRFERPTPSAMKRYGREALMNAGYFKARPHLHRLKETLITLTVIVLFAILAAAVYFLLTALRH